MSRSELELLPLGASRSEARGEEGASGLLLQPQLLITDLCSFECWGSRGCSGANSWLFPFSCLPQRLGARSCYLNQFTEKLTLVLEPGNTTEMKGRSLSITK